MIITLFLYDKIVNFRLPSIISGSYSFDNKDVDSKLINIDARDNKWILYSTSDSKIIQNGKILNYAEIIDDQFYILNKENVNYLIYVKNIENTKILSYNYTNNINLSIGNTNENNIIYNCPYIQESINISIKDNIINLEKTNKSIVYINKNNLNQDKGVIKFGDQIEIYGLRIIILNKLILIVDIKEQLEIKETADFRRLIYDRDETPISDEIKDIDLYNIDDYYSKSPRIIRNIEKKEIRLTTPPKNSESEELPLILTIGPMMTMGVMSATMLLNSLLRISNGETTFKNCWPQIISSMAMIISMVLWPTLTRNYNKKMKAKKKKEIDEKYTKYLNLKKEELDKEAKLESIILTENLITVENCLEMIQRKKVAFWNKRIDQKDFLTARIGIGNELLKSKLAYSEEDFTIDENELKNKADALKEEYKYIKNVPIGYSLFENKVTAVMGQYQKSLNFTYNMILQLLTFYSYEDLKICIFTNEKNAKNWEFLKYLNHSFTNDKIMRFFATNQQSARQVADYLNFQIMIRTMQKSSGVKEFKPYFLIIVDDCERMNRYDFVKAITEMDDNLGFSMLILENLLSRLPSKCNNFISLGEQNSEVLNNTADKQEQKEFNDEIVYNVDMMQVAKRFANVPIELSEGISQLPNVISFLELEKVGKVEQLNILNRWSMNDSTQSLKAEVGVDEEGELIYLDLHEKYHGPHGLIAGMTGSGKSEFIITYILSMAINYSPDDVNFILIDYKGGGLAFAFENKNLGMSLPHLAGVITNLDKAEMDRTLVSIDSELKRRQKAFNEARDTLGESTMDIYKYQRFYKAGELNEPIPHLFIICDEFAELKAQQPDFMDNLISIARIGRSLGVHLILATQKPSGVVNEQIWSNTKFRVCLKVQDESDSKEMLKRPDAAALRETGRFYLQVGYDEYFVLGQSAWCGDKYYPSDKIIKQVDKSVNFIDDCGNTIRSVQESNGIKIIAQGEQITSILNSIIATSDFINKKAKKLWLENIPNKIMIDNLEEKYNFTKQDYNVEAIIGEYDAPELQEQGLVKYNLLKQGNTIIYSIDGSEREMLLKTLIFSTLKNYTTDEINYYIIDYGSESLRVFSKFPHIGGMVYAQDEDKYNNLIKYISEEIENRKKAFADYNGSYEMYIKNSGKKKPLKVVIINNYDSIFESMPSVYEQLPDLVRDSERYGIIFIFTADSLGSIHSKIAQNCFNTYVLKLKDSSDYANAFGTRTKIIPRDIFGRGLYVGDTIHEFQTASIIENDSYLNSYILEVSQNYSEDKKATRIPVLPNKITYNLVKESYKGINSVPIGISKESLQTISTDFFNNIGNIITSNKINNTEYFIKSLLYNFTRINNFNIIVLDSTESLKLNKNIYANYYVDKFNEVIEMLKKYIKSKIDNKEQINGIIIVYGISKLLSKLTRQESFGELINLLKEYEKISIIIVDSSLKIKELTFNPWFSKNFSVNDGIWIGKGIVDQNVLHLSQITKKLTKEINNDMGYIINESSATLLKFINYEDDNNEK